MVSVLYHSSQHRSSFMLFFEPSYLTRVYFKTEVSSVDEDCNHACDTVSTQMLFIS